MKFTRNQIAMMGLGALVVIALIFVLFTYTRPKGGGVVEIKLAVWGADNKVIFEKLADDYKKIQPGATITYTQIDEVNYEPRLLNALAAGTGPDIFEIMSHGLPKQKDKLTPAPPLQFDIVKLRALFPQAVEQDFVSASGSQIYALPLYLDTLALLYNRDFFDTASIVSPPKTWDEFLSAVKKLRTVNSAGAITRAAAAIGGSEKTVDNAADLLELLMLQNGARMTDPAGTQATFNSAAAFNSAAGGSANPGLDAFKFYLQFANAASPYYTWNDSQAGSLDSFVSGKVAMIFGYAKDIGNVKTRSPFLNFAVAPMPQPKGANVSVNFPKYAGLAVSKRTQAPGWAWDFIVFATTNSDEAAAYAKSSGRPPALRDLVASYLNDPDLGVFASQTLSARSWHEADDLQTNKIMNDATESVLMGQASPESALGRAQDQVTALMKNNL